MYKKQIEVDSKETAMLHYQGALWEDCRINAFAVGQTNPDLLFFDIDRCKFDSTCSFKLALTATLRNIEKKLNGHPTVYESSSGGVHVIQPINCPIPLEQIKELGALEPETSNKFLQFAPRDLSNGKCDKSNYPALRSCLIRIPHTTNSKSKTQVKVIQEWDGRRPDFRLLIGSFHAELLAKQIERGQKIISDKNLNRTKGAPVHKEIVPWIEKLIQRPIDDYRKHARDLILIPYLVVSRGLNPDEVYNIVMEWADKCDKLNRLQPSRREFEKEIYGRIREVMRDRVPHMRLDTLKVNNQKLHDQLLL